MTDALSKAKDVLLRALGELEEAQAYFAKPPDRVDLIVIYSIGKDIGDAAWDEVGGSASTAGPNWMKAALLERAAQVLKDKDEEFDEPDEPEPPTTFGGP